MGMDEMRKLFGRTPFFLQQVRFPRSKKKRIRKKWASKEQNYTIAADCEKFQRLMEQILDTKVGTYYDVEEAPNAS